MRGKTWLFPLLFLIPAIMVATLGLGYYSYRSTVRLAETSEESVEASNRALGRKLIDRIEKVIIDGDRTFFRLVSLDDPREFRELWRRIVKVSPAVESVAVLSEELKLLHLMAKLGRKSRKTYRRLFVRRIIPDLELDQLPADQHRHLHKRYGGKTYLISYIRRNIEGRGYFICLSVNVPYLLREVFREEFKALQDTNTIAVTDEDGRVLYGRPIESGSSLVFEHRFATTLYKWRLQVAPRQLSTLRQGARARRVYDVMLVGSAVGVIWIGMFVLLIAMRKERRANEMKSEFISNVSHELKTPLSLIRMFGELLALGRAEDPKTRKEYAEIITKESDRLSSQIDNVLDFARIEGGKAAYEMERGDLRAVVERVAELCRYRSDQASVRLVTELPDEPAIATYDESAMTLLLLNLIENALKYGTSPGGEIAVTLVPAADRLLLRVTDQGEGIAPDEIKRIFERFYRGKSARRGPQRGAGIGLSLVRHVASEHGATVDVHSTLGKGSTFEVSIPVRGRR